MVTRIPWRTKKKDLKKTGGERVKIAMVMSHGKHGNEELKKYYSRILF